MIFVYTAFTHGYDALRTLARLPGVRYVAYSDRPFKHSLWEYRPLPEFSGAHWNRNAIRTRRPKLAGIEGHERTVWLDANIEVDLQELLEETREPGLYAAHHYARNCLYDEAEVVLERQLADPEQVARQIEEYRRLGYPRGNGLAMGRVIVRHNFPAIREFSECWWNEYQKHPTRDQLSLVYTAWRLGVPIRYLKTEVKWAQHLAPRKKYSRRED